MTWYRMQAGAQLQIRVTDPAASGTDGFVLASEVYEVTGTEPNALPSATTNNATGTGLWFHVTLDVPVALAPNTLYGFDLTSLSGLSGVLFFESAGMRDDAVVGGNPYADGAAYVSGAAGVADDLMTAAPGDHVFVVELAEAVPAPVKYPVVISDFEDGFDGWGSQDGWRVGVLSLSATGATEGVQAMLVEGNGGWQQMAMINLKPFAAALSNPGVLIAADVTAFPADMTTPWMQVEMVLNGAAPIGWSGLGGKGVTLDGQPQTLTWALSDAMVEKIAAGVEGLEYFELVLVSNMDGASVAKFYIDNVRVIKKPKVIFVTSIKDVDKNGVQDDQSWVDWLTANGYDVDARPDNWIDPLDANEIAELNAADLIIASRGMATDKYDGTETAKWNGVTTPIISTNAWMIRNNRWKWMNSSSANKDAGAPLMQVLDASHPVFADVVLDANGLVAVLDPNAGSGHTSFLTDYLDPGNGTLLAQTVPGVYTTAWIVEWAAGVEYYAGAVEVAGGRRMVFMAGTQDGDSGTGYSVPDGNFAPVGVFNLNAAGQKMFLNAMKYMIAPPAPEPEADVAF